jgi:hypothetical protein
MPVTQIPPCRRSAPSGSHGGEHESQNETVRSCAWFARIGDFCSEGGEGRRALWVIVANCRVRTAQVRDDPTAWASAPNGDGESGEAGSEDAGAQAIAGSALEYLTTACLLSVELDLGCGRLGLRSDRRQGHALRTSPQMRPVIDQRHPSNNALELLFHPVTETSSTGSHAELQGRALVTKSGCPLGRVAPIGEAWRGDCRAHEWPWPSGQLPKYRTTALIPAVPPGAWHGSACRRPEFGPGSGRLHHMRVQRAHDVKPSCWTIRSRNDAASAAAARASIGAKAQRSEASDAKVGSKPTDEALPVRSFPSLLGDRATVTRKATRDLSFRS